MADNSRKEDVVASRRLADGKAEALRLIDVMQQNGMEIRLLGGLAVSLRCPSASERALNRVYLDLDFVAHKKQARTLDRLLQEEGYRADRRFNALHGDKRLLFFDDVYERQVDIFLSVFEMCHKLVLDQRLELHPYTLDPANLLLTKLQIVELNEKDIQDILAIFLDFELVTFTEQPGEELDMSVIVSLCSQDWGWYTTVNDNLEQVSQVAKARLDKRQNEVIFDRIKFLRQNLKQSPKSLNWKMRDMIGRRMPWYSLPEEVRR